MTYSHMQESAVPTEKKRLEQQVSCLVCSQQQPMLLLVGSEEGAVSLLDMRKGIGHGNITPVYSAEVSIITPTTLTMRKLRLHVASKLCPCD